MSDSYKLKSIQEKIDAGEPIDDEDTEFLHEDAEETASDKRVEAQDAT